MTKKVLRDEELIEQFACKRVKALFPKTKAKQNSSAQSTWKDMWTSIRTMFKV